MSARPSACLSAPRLGRPGSAAGGTRGWAGPGRGREEEPERQVRDPGAGGRGGKGGGGTRTPRPSDSAPPPGAPCGRSPTPAQWAPWTRRPHPPELGRRWTGRRIGSPSPVGMCLATTQGEVLRSSRGRPRCAPAAARYPLPGISQPQLPQQRGLSWGPGPGAEAPPLRLAPLVWGSAGVRRQSVSGCQRYDPRPETLRPCAPSSPGRRGLSSPQSRRS